jgi:hypothetical protein
MLSVFSRRPWLAAVLLAAGLAAVAGVGKTVGSDHQDTPEVELSPRMDINDVYAFPGSSDDRIVLVMTTSSPITPAQAPNSFFDPNLLYQLKIDNNGDAIEDLVLQFTFEGTGANQRVHVRGPVRPDMAGTRNTAVTVGPELTGGFNTVFGSAGGVQVFAGLRDDPFFLDLEQFFRIIPDRRPVSGPLSQLPDQPSASSFRAAGQAMDYLRGLNTLALVIELPESLLTAGGTPKLGIWGTISR